MVALLGLVIILALAYLGSIYVFAKEKLPTPIRYLFYSGWEFILLGMALGPFALQLFPPAILSNLDPVIHLGLGWVGLLIGLQMKAGDIAKLNQRYLLATFLQSVFTGLAVAIVSLPFVYWFQNMGASHLPIGITVLAAASAISSPTILFLLGREKGFREGIMTFLKLITNLDAVFAIFAVGLAFCFLRPEAGFQDGLKFLLQSLAAGGMLAFIFYFAPRKQLSANEMLVVLFGFVLFSSGVGGLLQVSPLFLNMICGIFLANLLPRNDPFYGAIINVEKPLYVVLLIISGLMFNIPDGLTLILASLVIAVRLASKYYFISVPAPRLAPYLEFPPGTGFALTSQGAMALVIGLTFLSAYPGNDARALFSVIVLSVMVNEIIAPYLISHFLRKATE